MTCKQKNCCAARNTSPSAAARVSNRCLPAIRMHGLETRATCALIIGLISVTSFSCTENKPATQPASWSQQAINDPFNYSPHMDRTDISGGGLTDYDNKAMKRDINEVLNP